MRHSLTGPADGKRAGSARRGKTPRCYPRTALLAAATLAPMLGSPTHLAALPTLGGPSTAIDYEPPVLLVQGHGQPVLNVSKVILAEPAAETPLPIQVGPAEAIARNSFIRIRGLPAAAALTEGHSIAPGAWAIPIMALPNLRISLPAGQAGKSEVTVALVTVEGTIVAEAKTALIVAAASLIAPGDVEPKSKSVASLGPSPQSASAPPDDGSSRRGTPAPAMTEEQKQAAALLAKGDEQIAQGNIASARLFFERAAVAGLAQAALALAATYDPVELDRLRAQGVQPNPQLARKWYERARQLGAYEAEDRLRRLGAR